MVPPFMEEFSSWMAAGIEIIKRFLLKDILKNEDVSGNFFTKERRAVKKPACIKDKGFHFEGQNK